MVLATGQRYVDYMEEYMGDGDNAGLGEIACVLIGHTHADRVHISQIGIPYIITTCDQNLYAGGESVFNHFTDRIPNSITEQAFDTVIVNKNTHSVKLIRIGGLADSAP